MVSQIRGKRSLQGGIALILVLFILALASALVINMGYSVQLAGWSNVNAERAVKAEYLLKSILNVAVVMIDKDQDPRTDGAQDLWWEFRNGAEIPGELIQLDEPNVRLSLEVRPEDSKINLVTLRPPNLSNTYRDVVVRLFQSPGIDFDNDTEVDQSGYFPRKHFSAEEQVSAIIDFMDPDQVSYQAAGFSQGIEDLLPPGVEFPNTQPNDLSELSGVPGLTASRLRRIAPFATILPQGSAIDLQLNCNVTPDTVFRALDPDITDVMFQQIDSFRTGPDGPFSSLNSTELSQILGNQIFNTITPMVDYDSRWYSVIAKVDYQTSHFFLRALVDHSQPGTPPAIRTLELY